jgi:1-acyl-sn-glycerol-3-phosphate acyltransferase
MVKVAACPCDATRGTALRMALTKREILGLKFQAAVDWVAFPFIGPATVFWIRWLHGHRIDRLAEVRRTFKRAVATRRPMVICANHLTMVDSLIIHHSLCSVVTMFFHFRLFSWNVPAIENFKKSSVLRLYTFLGKTVPIDRTGSPEHHRNVLDKLTHLVAHGQVCTLFPEGGRSRTGTIQIDQVTYGVGQILKDQENPLVVCVYVRGNSQKSYSYYPARNDPIYVDAQILEPKTEATGLRAIRDLSRQVITKLKEMEDARLASGAAFVRPDTSGSTDDVGDLDQM